ncbi:trypsin-like peptidase domain-containing protein [Aquabacterium sp. A7-Y]|uniref:S1C family serine protease n=1 Tax=Aquabacterium sp. A7-Y TaxID=1349605 RepID=UPI00223E01AD|nr:trypsin-like peptidase domain-containing protein [Aquabacterium sp. A7-Y]MCW7541130.1 trypsin-like peptidase domain-containing protein [Aquabacterium sp. A7-Y]
MKRQVQQVSDRHSLASPTLWRRLRTAARRRIGLALLATAVGLAACGGGLPRAPQASSTEHPSFAPDGFATAVSRSLPVAVGVYGVGQREVDDNDLLSKSSGPTVTPVRLSGARKPRPAPTSPDLEAEQATIGAGFIIDPEGLIVTAGHVVSESEVILVQLYDQQVLRAELVGLDPDTDIALLRVALPRPLTPLFGQSVALRLGDWVLALGHPYGLDRSVTSGIVSGMNRHFVQDREVLFIQTDLALNPGNSGGALLDASGAIVGMNLRLVVGGLGSPGLGLAIPIEIVRQIAEELRSTGRIVRPPVGARFEDVAAPVAHRAGRAYASGALVTEVSRGGLAEALRLQVGDIVVGMNGEPIGESADLVRMLLDLRTAQGTSMTVYRGGRYKRLWVD